jgi:hypothetical protein
MGSAQGITGGGSNLRPSGEAAIPPQAAGPQRADPGRGVGDTVSCGHRGDPGPGRAAGSQPEELRAAARGDAQGPNAATPRGT